MVMRNLAPAGGSFSFLVDEADDRLDRGGTLEFSGEDPPGRCIPSLASESFFPSSAGADAPAPLTLHFDCYFESGERFIIEVRGLPEPRRWQTGDLDVELDVANIHLAHYSHGWRGSPPKSCAADIEGAVAHITVTEAEGGPRPYPDMVTPSFLRRFTLTVDFDDANAEPVRRGGPECGKLDAHLHAAFVLDARDYQHEPSATCRRPREPLQSRVP
ncbi:MAG: hypothetical protein DRJ42_05420 [Deltaproteobacteria bacterium]|nr:MAG: hypothetical protein DRJ42_05420 [Deltaproteobacteria bacterium]